MLKDNHTSIKEEIVQGVGIHLYKVRQAEKIKKEPKIHFSHHNFCHKSNTSVNNSPKFELKIEWMTMAGNL